MVSARKIELLEPLTSRQEEVLDLIARGYSNPEIATRLGVTIDGAKWHVREILSKLGVESREDAAAWWRSERRTATRVSRFAGLSLISTAGRVAIAAVTLAMAVAIVFLVFRPGDSDGPAAVIETTPTTAPQATAPVSPIATLPPGNCPIPPAPDARAAQVVAEPPVWLGKNCVGWQAADGVTEFTIDIRTSESTFTEWQQGMQVQYSDLLSVRFAPHTIGSEDPTLGPGCYFPQGTHALFIVRIATVDGRWLGGVEVSGCSIRSLSASGCVLPGDGPAAILSQSRWRNPRRYCITWRDVAPAQSYRFDLHYPISGERFSYPLPSQTNEYVLPDRGAGALGEPGVGIGREDYEWSVTAIAADGRESRIASGSGSGDQPE